MAAADTDTAASTFTTATTAASAISINNGLLLGVENNRELNNKNNRFTRLCSIVTYLNSSIIGFKN